MKYKRPRLAVRLKFESISIEGKAFCRTANFECRSGWPWESQLNFHRKVVVRSVSEPSIYVVDLSVMAGRLCGHNVWSRKMGPSVMTAT